MFISARAKAARDDRIRLLRGWRLDDFQFARDVTGTLLTKLGLVGLGLISNIVIARALGPEGRGAYVVAVTVGAVGLQLGNLGLYASNTYYVARDPRRLSVLFGNSVVFCGLAGIVAVFCALGLFWLSLPIAPAHGVLLVLAVSWVPIGLAYLLLQSLLIGVGAIRAFNTIELVAPAVALLLFAMAVLLEIATPEVFFVVMIGAQCVAVMLVVGALGRRRNLRVAPSLGVFREVLRYGLKAYFGALFSFLVLRSDLLLVGYLLGTGPTGQYATAVQVADALFLLPFAAGTVLFPRLSALNADADKWRLTVRVSVAVGLLTAGGAVLAGLVAHTIVQVFFGDQFLPAVPAIYWLLPGIVLLGINAIYMNYFASNGMPLVTIVSPGLALVVNLVANLVLIPTFGIVGASMSSSIAYGSMLACSIVYMSLAASRRPSSPSL